MPHRLSKSDWEDYLATGRIPPQIRGDVLLSWQRSSPRHIARLKRAPILSEEELLTQRALSRRLRVSAQTALARAGQLLDGTGNILLLCDRQGVVVDAAGDRRTLDRGRENHLHIGGNWSEAAIGTNAIGTALHMGSPVMIREAEHFCEEIQRWNCAATPVADPATGAVLGVVDISWRSGINPDTAAVALSATLAMQIESELRRLIAHEREALMDQLQRMRLRRGSQPMLVMDRAGSDVFATEDFTRFCENDDALRELRQRIPDLIDQTPKTIAEALSGCMPGTDLEIIGPEDQAIGVMISLRRPTRPAPDPGAELARIGRAGQAIARLCTQAQRLAPTDIPILIEGETGTGKSFLARAIHRASPQDDEAFDLLDCTDLTDDGLRRDIAAGRFDTRGVLCLNSPGAAPMSTQKLLFGLVERATEHGARIIALSTRHLYHEMTEGRFRSDLYYRIAGARLEIPPLRARRDEIEPMLRETIRRHADRQGARELRFTSGAMARLKSYGWPGNLREMHNLIAALDALSPTGLIDESSLPPEFREAARPLGDDTLRDAERAQIIAALQAETGNLTRAARRLGIARSTLYLKLDSYGIARGR
ncbi:sigma-54-dependent Fis family transcriptional regulator [Paracoccus sp. p4-l81]|uniref:sigma-54-dependent Fis family transcriptional regulator n=1 Tax=Paracoccus sp. p4-l81 TaxID=3342806 RepID=UPI0035B7A3BB